MTLISLLLVLSIERIAIQSQFWQADAYLQKYQGLAEEKRLVWQGRGGGKFLVLCSA